MMNISEERYEQLISIEARANAVVDYICSNKYMEIKDILIILGTEKATRRANEIIAEDAERLRQHVGG